MVFNTLDILNFKKDSPIKYAKKETPKDFSFLL